MKHWRCGLALAVLGCVSMRLSQATAGDDWLNWRGPAMTGTSDSRGLPVAWSESKNVVWKTALPHWSGSTPVITGDRIFLLSASKSTPDDKAEVGRTLGRKGGDAGGRDILLLCIDKRTGKQMWSKKLSDGNKFYAKHNMASISPVTDGKHVWAVSGTGLIAAYDFEGNRLWDYDLQKAHGEFGLVWGYASSPLLYEDKLIVQVLHGATNKNPSYLLALDKLTGKKHWYVERRTDAEKECPDAYTCPVILKHDGKTQIVVSGADWITAHDPDSGHEIWRATGLNPEKEGNYRICGTPLALDGMVIATSRIRPIIGVRAGGSGDVTTTHTLWTSDDRKGPDVPSAACDGRYIYLINDRGFASCLDMKTGKSVWGPKRIAGGSYSASPLVADGRIYITNEDCVTTVLKAGPAFEMIGENMLDGGYTLSSWAVSGDRMYLRGGTHLYCIGHAES